jgi:hypothetical protein
MLPHCRTLSALSLALYAGLSLSAPGAARATTQYHPFVLTAYGTGPGGQDLLAGRYPAAVRQLRMHGSTQDDPAALNANRCVAWTMTKQWRDAHLACDAAVRSAMQRRLESEPWSTASLSRTDRALAVAYADRAVLRWLSGDAHGAQADLASAQWLAPQASFVVDDLSALRSHPPQEQARGS